MRDDAVAVSSIRFVIPLPRPPHGYPLPPVSPAHGAFPLHPAGAHRCRLAVRRHGHGPRVLRAAHAQSAVAAHAGAVGVDRQCCLRGHGTGRGGQRLGCRPLRPPQRLRGHHGALQHRHWPVRPLAQPAHPAVLPFLGGLRTGWPAAGGRLAGQRICAPRSARSADRSSGKLLGAGLAGRRAGLVGLHSALWLAQCVLDRCAAHLLRPLGLEKAA